MSTRVKKPKPLTKKPPEVQLARRLEDMLLAAGMPADYGPTQLDLWHKRLSATDEVYRSGHATLMNLLLAKKVKQ